MIAMGSINSVIQSLGTASQIVKSFLELRTTTESQAKVIELQGVILAAQSSALTANSEQFSMLERIRALEEEIAAIEAWGTEKQRYELKAIAPGSFAYSLKSDAQGSEPPHLICAACYERRKKAILQRRPHIGIGMPNMLVCPECRVTISAP
jgi:hypothetical protein